MSEENNCITDKGKTAKNNGKMITLTFFKLYVAYIKKLGQILIFELQFKFLIFSILTSELV